MIIRSAAAAEDADGEDGSSSSAADGGNGGPAPCVPEDEQQPQVRHSAQRVLDGQLKPSPATEKQLH